MSATFQINKKVRNAVILNLRRVFTGDTKYAYVENAGVYDPIASKIDITDAIPDDHARMPHIVVDVLAGPEKRYIGPEDLREVKDGNNRVIKDEIFTSLNLTININVYTINDTLTRDEVLDRIYDQFKLITDDLADRGVEIISTTFNGDTRAYIRDRWYITGRLSINVYSEWKDELLVEDTVESIPIDVDVNNP